MTFDQFCSKNGNRFFFSFGLRLGMLFLKGTLRAGMENKVFGSETVSGFKEPGGTQPIKNSEEYPWVLCRSFIEFKTA